MGIKANFTKDDVRSRFDAFLNKIEKKQIKYLHYLGEMCVIEARNNKGYKMDTGALISSTGYKVYVDGVAVLTNFQAKGDAGTYGIEAGSDLADKIGKETKGVALVVVAGMNYAAYVEARGYNVLSSAEHLAQRELPRMLEKLITDIKRAAE